jgi:hypothetical protein
MRPLLPGEQSAVSAQGSAPAGRGVPGGIVQQFDRRDLPAVETEELREPERTPRQVRVVEHGSRVMRHHLLYEADALLCFDESRDARG